MTMAAISEVGAWTQLTSYSLGGRQYGMAMATSKVVVPPYFSFRVRMI